MQGTWCAIDVGLSHKGKRVKDMVQEMREQRIGMVQTPEQFTFVQRVLESGMPRSAG
jgi:protein tyrosine phosphatase